MALTKNVTKLVYKLLPVHQASIPLLFFYPAKERKTALLMVCK